jgi:hypothetical protein
MILQKRKPAKKKAPIGIYIAIGVVLVVGLGAYLLVGLLRTHVLNSIKTGAMGPDASGPINLGGAPKVVPAQGFSLNTLDGKSLPVAVPLYPGGTVYGLTTPILPKLANYQCLLEGTYDDPAKVTAFYEKSFPAVSAPFTIGGHYHWRGLVRSSPIVGVVVQSDSKGMPRDPRKWRNDVPGFGGGDPKETMISIIVYRK